VITLRRPHPRRWLGVAAVVPLLILSTGCNAVTTSSGFPTTGPLFLPGLAAHTCTASVVKSPTHDLLITAAHCVYGTGAGMSFVPSSVNGSAPYGRWTVTAAYVDASWRTSRNPLRDVAFLRVAPQRVNGSIRSVEQLTGGNALIRTPLNVGKVSVPAYTLGAGGAPLTCLTGTYRSGAYLAFDCGGYTEGVSGAPWIRGSSVLGVIGGLNQGGCTPSTSYSAPFDAATMATYERAVTKARGDVLPGLTSDSCVLNP
jgi:V8-like Glu-specific endopeptidase